MSKGKLSKFQKQKALLSFVVFVVLLAVFLFAAYKILSSIGTNIVVSYTNELADHDMQKIEEFVSDRWSGMEGFYRELGAREFTSVDDILDALNVKSYSGDFDHVYLIDADGKLYADDRTVCEKEENAFLDFFDGEKRNFVMRYDDEDSYYEQQNSFMLYGLDISDNPITIKNDSTTFVKMVVLNDISKIGERLNVASYNGRGYSSVIDETGQYIVNNDQVAGVNQYQNFFDLLSGGSIRDYDTEDIVSKINNGKKTQFWYTSKEGVTKLISVYPMDNSKWMLITAIEASVITDQINDFAKVTIMILLILVVAFVVALGFIRVSQSRLQSVYAGIIEGVFNRQYYNDVLVNKPVKAFAIIDLDRLKKTNDTYGHIAGDWAIESIAKTLVNNCDSDVKIVRFGGDEFILAYMEFIPADSFKRTLENINCDLRETKNAEFPELRLSCSIGGYYGAGIVCEVILKADNLLYEAKKQRDTLVTNI